MGCDVDVPPEMSALVISIHAPTWGATSFAPHCEPLDEFQSTHPRGVRLGLSDEDVMRFKFQSTHPRGVRLNVTNKQDTIGLFQSTHPRGVRPLLSNLRGSWKYFNPRTHVGCDCWELSGASRHSDFNPRTHVGCDTDSKQRYDVPPISIHAPTWGATQERQGLDNAAFISIHAPTWGATLC